MEHSKERFERSNESFIIGSPSHGDERAQAPRSDDRRGESEPRSGQKPSVKEVVAARRLYADRG